MINTGFLGGLVFVLVFAGMLLVHELGHFIAARLLRIEVEEFGIGFPPRLLRLWRGKGTILIGKERLILPLNFDLLFDPKTSIHRLVEATADSVKGRLVLRTIAFAATEDGQYQPDPHSGNDLAASQPAAASVKDSKDFPQPGKVHVSGILNEVRPGTEVTLNWIPLGGFNRIKGENDPSVPGGMAAASPWKRIAVLLAGPTMNLLAAVMAYTFLFYQIGLPNTHIVVIADVSPESPAEMAGIQSGDTVLAAAGESISSVSRLQAIIRTHLDQPVSLSLQRGDQQVEISVTPLSSRTKKQGAIGVLLGNPLQPVNSWLGTIPTSFQATYGSIRELLALPGQIIAWVIQPQEAQLAGPRSIWNLFQQTVSRDVQSRETPSTSETQHPTNYTLLAVISLTISLGVLNLLPIPALDGGRILFTLPEIVIRRRIPPKFEAVVHGVGLMVLMALLGYFYILDFIHPVTINFP
ncbi:MAG: M50 family metallopeptidase [Anaerolineales bacterium]|nr:M50 family metallopeptidase [Anaerolineales bacterium]